MSSLLHKRIKERRNSISNRELLVAAGTGDESEIDSLLREGAKVDFVDRDGNTALHYAVESGNLNSVQKLLEKGVNVSVENNANETAYDIAIRLDSEKEASTKEYRLVAEELEQKIFNDSFQLLEKAAADFKRVEIPVNASEQHESFLEREINNTENKMKYCLEYLRKLNKTKSRTQNLSFEEANVFLYFVEAFALQGSGNEKHLRSKVKTGDKNINLRTKVKEYFCPLCYSNDDLKQLENARAILVKKPEKKIRLDDVCKFIIGDVYDFFHKLVKYVKDVCERLDSYSYAKYLHCFLYKLETSNFTSYGNGGTIDLIRKELKKSTAFAESETEMNCLRDLLSFANTLESEEKKIKNLKKDVESFLKREIQKLTEAKEQAKKPTEEANNSDVKLQHFLKRLDTKDDSIGEPVGDIKTFLRGEFESLIKAAYGKQEDLPMKLFNFVTNFYPAYEKVTGKDFPEVSRLRNAVMHNLHKYGYAEFGNEIRYLKGDLFKYYFAQEIYEVIDIITPIQSPKIISKNFKDKLSHFKKEFDTANRVISEAQARDYFGFEGNYSQPLFHEADMDPEVLVDQYLKFMIIIDCETSEEDFLIVTGKEEVLNEKQDDFLTDNDNYEVRNEKRDDTLDDAERRKVFENFILLKRLKNFCKEGYDEEKQRLKEVLVGKHGVNGIQFDKVCETYIEKGGEFAENDKGKVKEIAETINNLKKIKDHYELSSQVIISLHSQFVEKQGVFDSGRRQNILSDVDEEIQEKIKNELPVDNTINITIGDEVFVLRTGKIISNMLKIFYNAFHEYQAKFNIEEIFNDDSFLEYLMRKEKSTGKDKSLHRIFVIIKKLLNAEFSAPFIVRLLSEDETGEVIETDDLVKLITILLKKKEGLYMKHLDYFLKESENSKLYETVCQVLLEQDVNIESMHLIFKEPQHAKTILNLLYKKIVSNCTEKRKIVELTKGVLIVMCSSSYDLQRKAFYDVALNVLDEMLTTQADLIRDSLIESNDLTFLKTKYLKAEIKSAQGKKETDEDEKKKLHNEALIISSSIQDALRYKKSSGDARQTTDLKGDEVPVYLLSSSTAAYSERLLGNYEAADERVEILYQDAINFALNLPHGSTLSNNSLTDEKYCAVVGSKKYQSFLNFSDESKNYLDILNIRIDAAYNKIWKGSDETYKKGGSSGLKDFEDALKILREVYDRQKHQGLEKFMIRVLTQISRVNYHTSVCWIKKTHEKKVGRLVGSQKALHYCHLAMQQQYIVYRNLEEMLWTNHPVVVMSRKNIIHCIHNAAYACNRIGKAHKMAFRQKRDCSLSADYFRKALDMYEKVYGTLRKCTQGGHSSLISKTVRGIAFTCMQLQNYEEARAKLKELLKAEEECYGKSHPQTEKTKEMLRMLESNSRRSSSFAWRKRK